MFVLSGGKNREITVLGHVLKIIVTVHAAGGEVERTGLM